MAGLASELTLNQTQELVARLGRFGLTLKRAMELLSEDDTIAEWLKAYPTKDKFDVEMPSYKLTVDYDLALSEMIAAGKYDWVYDEITEEKFTFTKKGASEIDLVLVHLDHEATTKQVEAELEERGLRAATIEELLALGATQPELQRDFPIVALGSRCVLECDGDVPVLCSSSDGREMSLRYYDDKWHDSYRFLAVRKPACPAGR